jgi:hypothetical protein
METTIVINKEKYIALKNELKSLAKEIRATKSAHKEAQRKKDAPWVILANLTALKFQARHKLIAYALTKGKEYEYVERKIREGNEPDWAYIKRLQDELAS